MDHIQDSNSVEQSEEIDDNNVDNTKGPNVSEQIEESDDDDDTNQEVRPKY